MFRFMRENSGHKTRRTLIIPEYEWGGGGNTGNQNRKCYNIITEETRMEIKRTNGEGVKERHKRQIKGDTQIAGDGEILSKTEDINTCGKKGTVFIKREYTL
jgi:hypothetical protein